MSRHCYSWMSIRGVTSKQTDERKLHGKKREKNQAFKCQPFIVWYFLSAGTGENQTSSVAFLLLFYNQFKTVLSWSLPETTICCFILEGIILKHKKAKSAINI